MIWIQKTTKRLFKKTSKILNGIIYQKEYTVSFKKLKLKDIYKKTHSFHETHKNHRHRRSSNLDRRKTY